MLSQQLKIQAPSAKPLNINSCTTMQQVASLTEFPGDPGGPVGPCGPVTPWTERQVLTITEANSTLLVCRVAGKKHSPHLLWVPVYPGCQASLCLPSHHVPLVGQLDLSSHRAPAEIQFLSIQVTAVLFLIVR